MANVAFKRGLSTQLPKTAVDGVFYLTTDTNRLYVGNGSTLVDLNRYILHAATANDLPSAPHLNDFAWVAQGNMLLVCTKENPSEGLKQWTQINPPDTNDNDDTSVTGISTPVVAATKDGGVTVSFNIQQQRVEKSLGSVTGTVNLDAIPVSFTISGADIATANNVAVGVDVAAISNGAKITTTGDGSDKGTAFVNIKGAGGATVSVSGDDITITSADTQYGIEATTKDDKAQIILTSDLGDEAVTLESANDAISVAAAADVVTVTHKDYGSIAATSTKTSESPVHGAGFTVIDSITTDKGHVTKINTKTVNLPADENTSSELSVVEADANAIIRLTEKDRQNATIGTDDVTLKAGTDIVVSGDADASSIEVAHKAYSTSTTKKDASANEKPVHGGTFTVVDSIAATNGHITNVYTKEITLPADENTTLADSGHTLVADTSGNLKLTLIDSDQTSFSAEAKNAFFFTVGDDGNKKTIYNQGDLDVYTRSEIDSMVEGVNAMSYKGTVGSGGNFATLPSEGVKVGDTYMVYAEGTYGNHECGIGDLLIATGSEENGVITSNLVWTYVPSGNDTDTQYELQVANNQIKLYNTVLKDNDGVVTIAEGSSNDSIDVSTVGNTISVTHKDFNAVSTTNDSTTANLAASRKFKVLNSVTTDNGHLTGISFKELTLPDDNNDTYELELQTGHKVVLNGTDQDTTLTFANDNYITLTDDIDNQKITIGHKAYSASLAATQGDAVNVAENNNKFVAMTGITRDDGGHLTSFTTQEFTVTDTQYELGLNADHRINLHTETEDTHVDLASANDYITLTDDVSAKKITFAHKTYTEGKPVTTGQAANDLKPEHGQSFTIVTDVSRDAGGHLTGYTTQKVYLPEDEDTQYELSGTVSAKTLSVDNVNKIGVNFKSTLDTIDNTGSSDAEMDLVSSSLSISAVSASAASIELVWGSFDS